MSATSSRTARVLRALRELLLTLAALGGAVCIVLTILAFTGGYSLIMFKTGSMSPTIPAGSVALVQRIPASEIAVGDVVTVDRPAALPVTHRVTSIADGASPDQRVITLRGDANEDEDPAPYPVDEVRIVRGSVPHLAHVIVWFGNPLVLGGITIGAAALVTWAFWPKARRDRPGTDTPEGADAAEADASERDAVERDAADETPRTRRERRAAGVLGAAVLLAAGVVLVQPAPAQAAGILTLVSSLSGTQVLDAVQPVHWDLDVDASAAPADGRLTVSLAGTPAAGDIGIVTEVRSCSTAWSASGCSGAEAVVRPEAELALDGEWERLLATTTPGTAHLRLSLTARTTGDEAASASLTVRANAAGETAEEHVNGAGELPRTGGTSWAIVAAPAAVMIGLGIALLARSRRKDRS